MKSFQTNEIASLISGVFFLAHGRTDESNRGKRQGKEGATPISEDNELNCSVPISQEILCNHG